MFDGFTSLKCGLYDLRGFYYWSLACPLELSIRENRLTSHLFLSLHRNKVPSHDRTVRLQRRNTNTQHFSYKNTN